MTHLYNLYIRSKTWKIMTKRSQQQSSIVIKYQFPLKMFHTHELHKPKNSCYLRCLNLKDPDMNRIRPILWTMMSRSAPTAHSEWLPAPGWFHVLLWGDRLTKPPLRKIPFANLPFSRMRVANPSFDGICFTMLFWGHPGGLSLWSGFSLVSAEQLSWVTLAACSSISSSDTERTPQVPIWLLCALQGHQELPPA